MSGLQPVGEPGGREEREGSKKGKRKERLGKGWSRVDHRQRTVNQSESVGGEKRSEMGADG